MSKKVLVTWIIALLFLGIAIGAQTESTEDTLFFFDTETKVQAENAEDTIFLFDAETGVQDESTENVLFASGDWIYRVRSDGNLGNY